MKFHSLLIYAAVLIIVGCRGHGSPPVMVTLPQNPVAIAKTDPNPRAINFPVNFSGSDSYDPDGGNLQLFEWDWNNDGTYDDTGENVSHTWNETGTYYVQLRVTDDESETDLL
ncbi:PKD domain-containing protein, partial [bacterium]|nr:PKD domain-containing protein [bacterium]